MAKERPHIDIDADDLFRQGMALPQVVGATLGRAGRIAERARRNARREGHTNVEFSVVQRHHPNGRTSFDVVSNDAASEYGTGEVRRLRALRRAAREVRR